MGRRSRTPGRLFALYSVATLASVLGLGLVLAISVRAEANRRGLSQAQAEAAIIAQAAIEPMLGGQPLGRSINVTERRGLSRVSSRLLAGHTVLRLRVRNLSARVVFSDDGSGLGGVPDDEALDAAAGHSRALLTHLNADANDSGQPGPAAVEVYLPLSAGRPAHQVGVLELYVAYAPIGRDVATGLHRLYLELAIGLVTLYIVLFAITASVTRGLRREATRNAFLAQHDVLTELPNRSLFHERARGAIAAAQDDAGSVAVAIVDLDRFKDINDTLGHHSGDKLLTELARRLSAHMRPGDTVARLGGDEFGLVLRDLAEPEPVLWRLRDVIDREIEVSGLPLSVQASIGFALAPEDGSEVEELLQQADVAMYAAKTQHTGLQRYVRSLDQYDAHMLGLVSHLRRAIDEDQLVLHYQPQTRPSDRRVCAVEALVRWEHPQHGLLYPDSFLPMAEQTDVIDRLTMWVLRTALRDRVKLATIEPDICVAVNVSARSIGRPSFADDVIALLAEAGVPGERLIIEVTETALLADPERASRVITTLTEADVRVSLDDFGQGQTSLGYLSALPVDELKIDRAFVMDMLTNRAHHAIVRSVIDLGHNLGLRVVAEGVETDAILSELHDAGCDVAQGYLFARPMPLGTAESWLRNAAQPPAHA